jgi:hypothetical protein
LEEKVLEQVIKTLNEIETGKAGITVYSTKRSIYLQSLNENMMVPLASAAKVALGFCVAQWVEP